MLKKIKINYEVLEMMVFFWESISSKEKVIDAYCIEVAQKTGNETSLYRRFHGRVSKKSIVRIIQQRTGQSSHKKRIQILE